MIVPSEPPPKKAKTDSQDTAAGKEEWQTIEKPEGELLEKSGEMVEKSEELETEGEKLEQPNLAESEGEEVEGEREGEVFSKSEGGFEVVEGEAPVGGT